MLGRLNCCFRASSPCINGGKLCARLGPKYLFGEFGVKIIGNGRTKAVFVVDRSLRSCNTVFERWNDQFDSFCPEMRTKIYVVKGTQMLASTRFGSVFNVFPCLQSRSLSSSSSNYVESKEQSSDSQKKKESPYMNSISRSSVVVKVKDLEEHLRIRGYSTLRWGLGILSAVGFGIYMFREPIKDNLSDEVADVASRSLGDQNVVLRANEISKAIVNEVLNDSNTLELATDFVVKLLEHEDIRVKAQHFVISVMDAPETRMHVNRLAAGTVASVLETESTRQLLLDFVKSILLEEETVESCKQLLNAVASDPQSKQILADFFKDVLVSDTVTDQAIDLGKHVSREVVMDKKLQEESVDALWSVFKMSLTPGWLFSSKEISKKPA
eukprot:gene20493-22509_t